MFFLLVDVVSLVQHNHCTTQNHMHHTLERLFSCQPTFEWVYHTHHKCHRLARMCAVSVHWGTIVLSHRHLKNLQWPFEVFFFFFFFFFLWLPILAMDGSVELRFQTIFAEVLAQACVSCSVRIRFEPPSPSI